jgi:adenylate kinase
MPARGTLGQILFCNAHISSWLGYSHAVADPELIFQLTWRRLVQQQQGEENIQMPCEILFLGGAPGAGKGTMTPFIMRERGLDAQPIVMSSLLNSPAAKKIIEAGGLVSDFEVFQMLLEQLAKGEQANGCMVDGFPRTVVQVELLRLLHTKMKDLSGSLRAGRMPRPRFRMCILYVDEHESVQRQLSRGRQALEVLDGDVEAAAFAAEARRVSQPTRDRRGVERG